MDGVVRNFFEDFAWLQYAPPIEKILSAIPRGCTKYFAKIDLSDAYHCVRIPASISPLFCTTSIDENGFSLRGVCCVAYSIKHKINDYKYATIIYKYIEENRKFRWQRIIYNIYLYIIVAYL